MNILMIAFLSLLLSLTPLRLMSTLAQQSSADVELSISEGSSSFQNVTVMQGASVRIRVTSDVADTLLVKGYDKRTQLEPNKESTLTFAADKKGTFDFVLERNNKSIGVIVVQ